MNIINQHNHKGFTLIETLFAVLIFSAALISLMAIAGRGIAASNTAREQTTAHYLAQEGVEVVRNARDANFINGDDWMLGIATQCTASSPCQLAYSGGATPTLIPCTTDPVKGCNIQESFGAYFEELYQGGTATPYFRKIYVVPVGTPDLVTGAYSEYQVVSRVSWRSKNVDRVVDMETLLKQWQ
jgi:type II secretory pathway pseudopilin PulG